jgi:hypothetical protein
MPFSYSTWLLDAEYKTGSLRESPYIKFQVQIIPKQKVDQIYWKIFSFRITGEYGKTYDTDSKMIYKRSFSFSRLSRTPSTCLT